MKKFFLALMAVAAIALSSCSDKPTVNTIAGSWVYSDMTWDVQANDTAGRALGTVIYRLEMDSASRVGQAGCMLSEDGKVVTSDQHTGIWELSGNIVTITTNLDENGGNSVKFTYKDGKLVWVEDRLPASPNLVEWGITKYVVTTTLSKGEFQTPN